MAAGRSADQVIWMRPERTGVGRPAQHSRAEITGTAIAIADAEGLAAVSMRRVAAELGTGAASLYRYLDTREDLLDLMADATVQEYRFAAPTGDWLADLVATGRQLRSIMRRHPWLVSLALTRPVLGPGGLTLLDHFLSLLAGHPADAATKLEAFALVNGMTATFAQYELAGGQALQERSAEYILRAAASGEYPALSSLLTSAPPAPASASDRYGDILARILTGLLGPAPAAS